MNKKDLILAKKAVLARQTRHESLEIRRSLSTARSLGRSGSGLSASQSSYELPSMDHRTALSDTGYSKSGINYNNPNNDSSSTNSNSFVLDKKMNPIHPELNLNDSQSELVRELSNRSVTAVTGIRKLKNEVSGHVMGSSPVKKPQGPSISNNDSTELAKKVFDENFFMPKKTILRSDGASLFDVYMSKRKDTWGSIIRSQYLEDEDNKKLSKLKKLQENETFGKLLHDQVLDREQRRLQASSSNDNFANLEAATTRRRDEMNKKREEDSRNRYKDFVANAVADCEIKKKRLEKEWREDIEAAMQMIKMDNDACEKERQKMEHKKEAEKHLTEILFKENLESIERKRQQKLALQEEIKRINAVAELNFQKEEAKRKKALDDMMIMASDGPAHRISQQIKSISKMKEDEFYNKLLSTENGLSAQLKKTEDDNAARLASNGKGLSEHWDKNIAIKKKEKLDLELHSKKINEVMKEMTKKSLIEDDEKRHLKHLEKLEYQRTLDSQVKQVRNRSLMSLRETMTEKERLLNSQLIQKSASILAAHF